ncbi:hypothetical protein K0M31_019246 [Melipona bicolor]|uniref:Uncharacterized protein n=1 Tax=Melipona bicolor TaxID=60889 RepID=A0AA40KQX9_9HYME|nr:hypothetical protein K0M31_019246 [Melipona bicolor]
MGLTHLSRQRLTTLTRNNNKYDSEIFRVSRSKLRRHTGSPLSRRRARPGRTRIVPFLRSAKRKPLKASTEEVERCVAESNEILTGRNESEEQRTSVCRGPARLNGNRSRMPLIGIETNRELTEVQKTLYESGASSCPPLARPVDSPLPDERSSRVSLVVPVQTVYSLLQAPSSRLKREQSNGGGALGQPVGILPRDNPAKKGFITYYQNHQGVPK